MLRLLHLTICPPENDCGARLVMHRHLVERRPFDFKVVTAGKWCVKTPPDYELRLPYPLHRLAKCRFGPLFRRWLADYENVIWPLFPNRALDRAIAEHRPHVLLALADQSLCLMARRAARQHRLPLAGLFLDWFPIMYHGHAWTRDLLSRRFREFYAACDLAFCTSDGMQEVLGPHPNSHIIYPMPGRHQIPNETWPPPRGKFRLVYVGSVENFYGRMLCALIEAFQAAPGLEIIVIGPNADWPKPILEQAKANGAYLGFKPPQEAAAVLAGADALLVVMSFEEEYRLFMRTSFTTKFLDYTAFGKPIILWGPDYCTPAMVVRKHGGALPVNQPEAQEVAAACQRLAGDPALRDRLAAEARHLHATLFNPERLQGIFVAEIERLTQQRTN